MVGSSLLCMPTQSIVCSSRDSDTCTLDNSILSISHLASLHEPSSSLLFKTARNLGPLRLRSADPGHDLHIFDTCDRHTVSKKARRKTHEHTTERHMRHTPSGNHSMVVVSVGGLHGPKNKIPNFLLDYAQSGGRVAIIKARMTILSSTPTSSPFEGYGRNEHVVVLEKYSATAYEICTPLRTYMSCIPRFRAGTEIFR